MCVFVIAAPPALPNVNPAFDCSKAAVTAEQIICATPELAVLDRFLATLYAMELRRAKNNRQAEEKVDYPSGWIAQRNECEDVNCLRQAYSDQLAPTAVGSGFPGFQTFRRKSKAFSEIKVLLGEGGWSLIFMDTNNGSTAYDGYYASEEEMAFVLPPNASTRTLELSCKFTITRSSPREWQVVTSDVCGVLGGGVDQAGTYRVSIRKHGG